MPLLPRQDLFERIGRCTTFLDCYRGLLDFSLSHFFPRHRMISLMATRLLSVHMGVAWLFPTKSWWSRTCAPLEESGGAGKTALAEAVSFCCEGFAFADVGDFQIPFNRSCTRVPLEESGGGEKTAPAEAVSFGCEGFAFADVWGFQILLATPGCNCTWRSRVMCQS